MTVIAWDGTTMASDRMGNQADLAVVTKKLFKINGHLLGFAGDAVTGIAFMDWFEKGCDPDKFPDLQKDKDNWAGIICITPDKRILRYEYSPLPFELYQPYVAIGSGRDYAVTALHLGKTAVEAVEIANELCISCGKGVDTITF